MPLCASEPMFKKILIANRGEIAIRVIRTCRELGIATVAVFSEADRGSLHVRYADEAHCVGPAPSAASYLDIDAIMAAVRKSGAEAIHPGYGFLSENIDFARRCQQEGVVYIGPTPEVIEQMGNKTRAREIMIQHGVPVIPGGSGPVEDYQAALNESRETGFPVMLKAASGGGGKGMRIVNNENELKESFAAVRREALASFADSRIFVEKYFTAPRHIEVQILADAHGHYLHLFERECSIQRRYQKVIEECPASCVDQELREQLTRAAIRAARSVGYTGAGTVEFLLDSEKNFYFLEMNTRIQVEHSVTELVTGIDMVREQIIVAAGLPFSFQQQDIVLNGAALECRIYAEDPENDYLPAPGPLKKIIFPEGPGVRVDSGVYPGWLVSVHYDPMLAKIAVWGHDREEARRRMLRALEECLIYGVRSNIRLHKLILGHEKYISGDISTGFIAELGDISPNNDKQHDLAIIAAICASLHTAPDRKESSGRAAAGQGSDLWRMASKYQFWASRF